MGINELIKNLNKNKNGITLNLNGSISDKKKGYYVSITNNKFKVVSKYDILKILLKAYFMQLIKRKKYFIGGWFDIKKKVWYIDISLLIDKKKNALFMGKKHKQKAIFSLYSMSTIYL